ncbi:stealth conserved region 3 domain-containing protein [Nocardioides campestrisoli]|uniref:stealth conserved region 3 domain-containing protein n=1 Tax=Nocardioides campestrisoli TaxID=2736757 RepID=UPI00163DDC2F|nr:stealth conserved region 3 domain-containing protein [Nocardioides campestrisoli]
MRRLLRRRGSDRLRIAFLVLNLDGMGGTSRSAITQAGALAARHDVSLISVTRSADAPHYPIDPRVEVRYLADVRTPDPGGADRRPSVLVPARWDGQFSALTDTALTEALPRVDVDVLVTVTPALLAAAVQLTPDEVAVVHQEHRSSADRVGGMEPLLAFAPRADAVALLTDSSASWLAAELGPVAPELVVVPNPLPPGDQPRSSLDQRRIVAAGRLVAEKQSIHLVRAFGELVDAGAADGWTLRILGDGPLREELRAHVAKAGLTGRVELPGAVDDMGPEWAAASVCALSSRTEGFPLVAQEAMSAGVPVVSYDCPSGPRELVEHEVSGLLVAAGAKAGLTAALARVCTDDTLLRRLGQGAYDAAQAYRPEVIAARWEEIFTRVAGRREGRSRVEAASGGIRGPRYAGPRHTQERAAGVQVPLVTPEQARRESLDLLVAAAEPAADWFVVPPHAADPTTVVVPAEHRRTVLDRLAAEAPTHLSLLDPGERGWPERRLPVPEMAALQQRAMTPRLVLEPWPRGDDGRPTHLRGAGVSLEFWDRAPGGDLVAPRPNAYASTVPAEEATAKVAVHERIVPTLPGLAEPRVDECRFPVDVVYTWVDGDDPTWNAARETRLAAAGLSEQRREASGQARFRSRDELRYSMRSVHLFAPWVRTIHLVTAGQRPDWLSDEALESGRVRLVDHREILPASALPTFSSQAIETALHRVPDLAEHFVYLNDDVFLGRPVRPELFFSPGGDFAAFVGEGVLGLPDEDPGDLKPFLQAAANNRRLLSDDLGVLITRVMAHTPHPHRVSVLTEVATRYAAAVDATAHAPFRSPGDVSMLSSLAQHYGLATGTAYAASAEHAFLDLSNARVERQLRQLRARDKDFFCVGDHHDFALDAEAVDRALAEFLEVYFPVPAPWER